MATKFVYSFGGGKAEGSSAMRNLLGGKGSELAEMTNLGIPVPPGFTISTEAWTEYTKAGRQLPAGLWEQITAGLARLEAMTDTRLGDAKRPLLVSVRSGARVSMPGMMETVLNLGLNDRAVEGLAAWTGNERFAWDCYRRFVTMFGDVVLGIRREAFDEQLDALKARLGVTSDPELPADELRKLTESFLDIVSSRTGEPFPQDPQQQLERAIRAVFDSWFAKKATEYRRIHGIPAGWGTAVTVMAMVFGNLGEQSGTGVGFTRDPRTGERRFYAEFLASAQGEDVVAGLRTPEHIDDLRRRMPAIYDELVAIADRLERHYKDMQDIEFTIQEGTLYILQTRAGKRSGAAAIRVAVDLVHESVIDCHTALLRVPAQDLDQVLHPRFDAADKERAIARGQLLAKGLPASPGAAVGHVVFDADRAVEWAKNGERVILVRSETSPEDVAGMYASEGIVTCRGGRTSHAAVVAVGMGKPCVVGAGAIVVDEERRVFEVNGRIVREGEVVSVEGGTGEVILDAVKTIEPQLLRFDNADKERAIADARLVAKGLPAAPGAAVGHVVFDAGRAVMLARSSKPVILVRPEASTDDYRAMCESAGIITCRGGRTSRASLVAVGIGRPCVVGAEDIVVDEQHQFFEANNRIVREGDIISMDGGTGELIIGAVKTVEEVPGLRELLGWADRVRTLGVRANADTPEDARKARELGAEGVGLVRTEHMFFAPDRVPIIREMIMATDAASRRAALARLLPFQREDFIGIFQAMDGLPVTIRLLDPPLHEFLTTPKEYKEWIEKRASLDARGVNPAEQRILDERIARYEALREANPMLGHRGCRLGITHPEIYGMQVRAIMEAACTVAEQGVRVEPEIMIPLTGTVGEMRLTYENAKKVADGVLAEMGMTVKYLIGTMIEVPRAALIADRIAQYAEFFSFGTNDLTQMTFGYSRDDVAKFLPDYLQKGVVAQDPFAALDQEGVGELIRIGIERGRRARPDLKVGICGEHGGDPSSVEFCHRVDMTYVSCSPYKIPIARLSAAQARIRAREASEAIANA
jgi:phosphoenolpyruvate synthase/pyruvate phosphate dikinase